MMHLDLRRDTAKTFPKLADPESFTSLRVWHCKYRTLSPIKQLTNLRRVEIAGMPDDSLQVLASLKKLEWLSIRHLPRVRSLGPLAELTALKYLELRSTVDANQASPRTLVDSLLPLSRLPELVHLTLVEIGAFGEPLTVLERCRSLRSITVEGFPATDIRALLNMRPLRLAAMPEPGEH